MFRLSALVLCGLQGEVQLFQMVMFVSLHTTVTCGGCTSCKSHHKVNSHCVTKVKYMGSMSWGYKTEGQSLNNQNSLTGSETMYALEMTRSLVTKNIK